MLTSEQVAHGRIEARNRRRERRLWERPNLTPSLGCVACPEREICGGLRTRSDLYDCTGHCCGDPTGCTKVCRWKPADYVQRVREIGQFHLGTTPRTAIIPAPELPRVAPLLYHGNRRDRPYDGPAVALSLHRLLNRTTGDPKYRSEVALREAFKIGPETKIILTGTDQDGPLERWWALGVKRRAEIISALRDLGVKLVTTPNYSLFLDTPRWDDLHSIKRIALINAEFQAGGLATALHVNARTDRDMERWAAFVAEREEITSVAYEFTTGSSRNERRDVHARWLAHLAQATPRPLTLIVRGGVEVLPMLTTAYAAVTVVETSAFMKTMKRQAAAMRSNDGLTWESVPTEADEPLDDLYAHNLRMTREAIELMWMPRAQLGVIAA